MRGVAGAQFETLGYFDDECKIDDIMMTIRFHIVRDTDVIWEAVIGLDIIQKYEVVLRDGEVLFKGLNQNQLTQDYEFYHICTSSLIEEITKTPEVDLEHLDCNLKSEVEEIISDYNPKKIKNDSPIEMKIILADDNPVYQRPRRISYDDQKIVEN